MSEESGSQAVDTVSIRPAAEAGGPEEGGSRGMLRGAIQKVMEEIEHHERQARHHLQQAAELRKALRESISFLQEQGEKRVPIPSAKGGRPDKAAEPPAEGKAKAAASSGKHHRAKKK